MDAVLPSGWGWLSFLAFGSDKCARCTQAEYVPDLINRLGSSEWMANTGLPLFATLVGLLVAFDFLRRQIASDQAMRRAEHRRESALSFGHALLAATDTVTNAPSDTAIWCANEWPGASAFQSLLVQADLLFPDSADYLSEVGAELSVRWLACVSSRSAQELKPYGSWSATEGHRRATEVVLSDILSDMRRKSEPFLTWDGEGTPPVLASATGKFSLTRESSVKRYLDAQHKLAKERFQAPHHPDD